LPALLLFTEKYFELEITQHAPTKIVFTYHRQLGRLLAKNIDLTFSFMALQNNNVRTENRTDLEV
jgi:hypothetical protein